MSDALKQAAVAAAVAAAETVNASLAKPDLSSTQVADIAANLPAPQAMESLLPQVGRQLLVAIGAFIVGKGYLSDSDWQTYSGAALVVAPIAWRIATTVLARRGIGL